MLISETHPQNFQFSRSGCEERQRRICISNKSVGNATAPQDDTLRTPALEGAFPHQTFRLVFLFVVADNNPTTDQCRRCAD